MGQAIRPGGIIYIVGGGILDDPRLSAEESLSNNLGFINQFDQGKAHTDRERRTWLTEAGFQGIERVIIPNDIEIMTAKKSG